jgi:enoyl-CoA hydratase
MPRASDLRLNAIKLAQDGRVLTATAVAPPLNFVTTEFIRDLDRLTTAVDTDDSVGAVVLTGGLPGRFLIHAAPDVLSPFAAVLRYGGGSQRREAETATCGPQP